jgi:hypothetical protein
VSLIHEERVTITKCFYFILKKKKKTPSPSLGDNKDEWRWGASYIEKRAFELMIKINHI